MGLSWVTLLALVRLITPPKLATQPLPIEAAWQQVEEWLASPMVWIPSPTERHGEIQGARNPKRRFEPKPKLFDNSFLVSYNL